MAKSKHHFRPRWRRDSAWAVLGVVALLALLLGVRGFAISAQANGTPSSLLDRFYLSLGLFVFQSGAVPEPVPWQLQIARFLAPMATATATAGLLLAVLGDRLNTARAHRLSGHVVICGLDRVGVHLARAFGNPETGERRRVVIVEKDPGNAEIQACRDQGMIVLVGNATDTSVLERAGVSKASYLFCACPDDTTNGKIAARAWQILSELGGHHPARATDTATVSAKGDGLTCLVRVSQSDHASLIEDVGSDLEDSRAENRFRLYAFDVSAIAAKEMLRESGLVSRAHVPSSKIEHLVVVGAGEMGQQLVLEAARLFRNGDLPDRGGLVFTLVDKQAKARRALLLDRDPSLQDMALEAIETEVESVVFRTAEFLTHQPGNIQASRIYVCLSDDVVGMSAARILKQSVDSAEILVRTKTYEGLPLLADKAGGQSGIHPFELLQRACRQESVEAWILRCDERRLLKSGKLADALRVEQAHRQP